MVSGGGREGGEWGGGRVVSGGREGWRGRGGQEREVCVGEKRPGVG